MWWQFIIPKQLCILNIIVSTLYTYGWNYNITLFCTKASIYAVLYNWCIDPSWGWVLFPKCKIKPDDLGCWPHMNLETKPCQKQCSTVSSKTNLHDETWSKVIKLQNYFTNFIVNFQTVLDALKNIVDLHFN